MKWKLLLILFVMIFSGTLMINSCRKGAIDLSGTTPKPIVFPPGFPAPVYDFNNNPITKEGFELGRRLFYDGRLSLDGNYPCSSCHQQIAVFGTYDHDLSHGYNDQHTDRNAPGLFNLAWRKEFHADGRFKSLEDECLQPIQAPNEMAEEVGRVLLKLRTVESYRQMFEAAFGSGEINIERMQKALAQFTVSMITANSKYDQVKRGVATFSDYEQRGYALFQTRCASCHLEPLFTDNSYRNNGIGLTIHTNDFGRMRVTGKSEDSIKFRVPSLRNVSLTFPYMHDGRFNSLRECIEHYAYGIQQGPTLDPALTNGIPVTNNEVIDLVAFLRALTDSVLVNDLYFSRPQ